jgi:Xaa-Pro dipeptidase
LTTDRLNRLFSLMKTYGLDAMVFNPGPSLNYLIGLSFHLMERPVVLLLIPNETPVLIMPELETAKLPLATIPLEGVTYGENPATWRGVFVTACQNYKLEGKKIGVEPTRLRFLELRLLEKGARGQFISAEEVISGLRMQKDASEIEMMRRAVSIAQEALLATLPFIKAGKSEREIAAELSVQLLRAGSDSEVPFTPIVSSGANSANPHATPSDRRLQRGDLLVIDWGATYHGYVSDLTRTFAIGEVDAELKQIAGIVEQANAAGRSTAGPEKAAGEIDQAARAVITDAGYSKYFTHRTGHGIGLEGHEPPYIYAENPQILLEGMAFTVEPGIYLPGRGGVRIEDNVVITASGSETLSSLPRQLQTIE